MVGVADYHRRRCGVSINRHLVHGGKMSKQTEAVVIGGTNEGRYIPLDHFRVGDHRPTIAFTELPSAVPDVPGDVEESIPFEVYRLDSIFFEKGEVKFWTLESMTNKQALERLLRVMAFGVHTVQQVRHMLPKGLKNTEMGHGYDIACDRLAELFGQRLRETRDE
jgi:hypothetical protein